MNAIAESLVDGLIDREADCGSTITWAGADYPCSGGSEMKGKKLDIGGFQFNADCVLVIRTSLFGSSRPQEKQTLLYTSTPGATATKWRIDTVRILFDAFLVLECNYPNSA